MSGTLGNPADGRVRHGSPLSPLVAPLAAGAALAGVAAYVVAIDPADGPGLLPCPFRATTGLWCPGCGLTRATHHLFHGHLTEALRFNLLVVPVLVVIVVSWLTWVVAASGRRQPAWNVPSFVWSGAVAVAIGFAVVRNLPFVHGLRG